MKIVVIFMWKLLQTTCGSHFRAFEIEGVLCTKNWTPSMPLGGVQAAKSLLLVQCWCGESHE